MTLITVVGTRPNFMKMAPIIESLKNAHIQNFIVHTGQHYDEKMSKVFFDDLKMPQPDIFLGVGSGSHAETTSKIMVEFEKICKKIKPRLVLLPGDVNSTLACALATVKLNIPIAHIEAGLRSFDNSMPEEINRILTDRISDILFTTELSGTNNLLKEGIEKEKISFVGNCMIDSLKKFLPEAIRLNMPTKYGLVENDYCLITLHRPSNVDIIESLKKLTDMLNSISKRVKMVFPIHPRTKIIFDNSNLKLDESIILLEPLPYIEFLSLMNSARVVITDSGGIQEETTYLGVQCITVRDNTERPITVDIGTNHLAGSEPSKVLQNLENILNGSIKNGKIPLKWDGRSSKRILKVIQKFISK